MPAGKQDEGKPTGFKVSDRRSFAESSPDEATAVAQQRAETPSAVGPAGASADPGEKAPATAASARDGGGASADTDALPPVDFHTFILSLGSSALLHLGELDHPDGGEGQPDLRLAKHTIDIIGMLQEKTRGNLSPPEERLMESLLYDLRLRYVERGKAQAK